jgi:hypothetical protein
MSTREYTASGFSDINLKWAMDIQIERADTFSVVINGSETQLDNFKVSVDGNVLNLGYNLNLVSVLVAPFSRMSARITLPELRALNLSGASHTRLGGFKSQNDFRLSVSGASQMEFLDIATGNLRFEISGASRLEGKIESSGNFDLKVAGASKIDLEGFAKELSVDAAGASHLDLEHFAVQNAKLKLSGASKSLINVNGKMDLILEGASNLIYTGQAVMGDVKINGASSLKRK